MDSQGPSTNAGGAHAGSSSAGNSTAMGSEFCSQGSSIPPAPFFGGFPHPGVQMPFLFPQRFMPPLPGMGFPLATHGSPNAPVDLTESVAEETKSAKKRRVAKKNPEIIELDDVKEGVDVVKSGGHWKDHWVIQLITIRGEMHSTFSTPPKQGVDNWSRLHTKLVSMCPDFSKDSEACRKKWSTIYTDYKEDKALNLKSGSQRSEKCRWYHLVDEFMFDSANVVSHAHASVVDGDGVKCTITSEVNTPEQKNGESSSKSTEPKRKDDMFVERCMGKLHESSKILLDGLKANDDIKMSSLMSMQKTMEKLVDKL